MRHARSVCICMVYSALCVNVVVRECLQMSNIISSPRAASRATVDGSDGDDGDDVDGC